MGCGKKVYTSKKQARRARKQLNKKFDIKLTNIYWCDECSHYHLTTMKKKVSRNITRNNKNIKY